MNELFSFFPSLFLITKNCFEKKKRKPCFEISDTPFSAASPQTKRGEPSATHTGETVGAGRSVRSTASKNGGKSFYLDTHTLFVFEAAQKKRKKRKMGEKWFIHAHLKRWLAVAPLNFCDFFFLIFYFSHFFLFWFKLSWVKSEMLPSPKAFTAPENKQYLRRRSFPHRRRSASSFWDACAGTENETKQ